MNDERLARLQSMKRGQLRTLKEQLVACLVCAAHNLRYVGDFEVAGRPGPPETHDFDAKSKCAKEMLAIEITEFHGTYLDKGVLNPEIGSFWWGLTREVEACVQGKVQGTFGIHGGSGSEFPNIPGNKRKPWVQAATEAISNTARILKIGESKRLGSPPEIADMQLMKLNNDGSRLYFSSSPTTSQSLLVNTTIESFCGTTLAEKNNGSLAVAKSRGKRTILAVGTEYPLGIDELALKIRGIYLKGAISNIDHIYLVNRWESEDVSPLLLQVF